MCVGGYSDGAIRVFDLTSIELQVKAVPHDYAITKILFSTDGIACNFPDT